MKSKYPAYEKGMIDVSDGHTLNFELYGNPKGIPVVYLHGGPGGGFDDKDKRFFDPKIWNVLLFDQRGAGKSIPFASVENNTTQELVGDINFLTKRFGLKKFFLFGGSWGSTLSLVYSILNPEKIKGMVLRGIYLNTQAEQNYIYKNARFFRPKVWERFMSLVPKNRINDVINFYHSKIFSKDPKIGEKYCFEWSLYELSLLYLKPNIPKIEKMLKKDPVALTLARIEDHYFINNCFLEENFIIKNIDKINHIPTYIVHGAYDLVCPPSSAYWLHNHMPKSGLHMVHAGHSSSERAISRGLMEGVKEMEKRLNKPHP